MGEAVQANKRGSDVTDRIGWLKLVRLFEDIRDIPDALEAVAQLLDARHYQKGVDILKEGENGSDAFFLTSGTIKVVKSIAEGETYSVALLEAKDHPFFGEAALLQSDKRSATIRSETDCVCLILHKAEFDALCKNHPQWALPVVMKIARVVLERLHKANNDVVLLYHALVNEIKG